MDKKLIKRKEDFLNRVSKIFNISIENAESLFIKRPKMSLSVIKKEGKDLIKENNKKVNLSKIDWANDAYVIEGEKAEFTHSREFEQGFFYIQNASSLLPPKILEPKENETILDMCAAPGGKTIQIAKLSNNKAKIYVNDENKMRIQNMKKIFNIYGIDIKEYYSQPAQYLSKYTLLEYFDKILIDAPCSGEGLLDLSKINTLKYWSAKKIKRLTKLQKNIISEAYKLLKPGGIMVYSTCTLAPEENEEIIDWTITNFKNLSVEEIKLKAEIDNTENGLTEWEGKKLSKECTKCLRVKPNTYMEAFFVCKLKKSM